MRYIRATTFEITDTKLYIRLTYIRYSIATTDGDDYTTGCLLDYNYFNKNYKILATDLSKQQAPDADLKAIKQNNLQEI